MRIFGVSVWERERVCVCEWEGGRKSVWVSVCSSIFRIMKLGAPLLLAHPHLDAVGAGRGGDCDNKLWSILKRERERERYSRYRMRVSSPLSFYFFSPLSLSFFFLSRLFTDGKKDGKTAPPYKSHTVIWLNNPDWEGREWEREWEREGDVKQVVCHWSCFEVGSVI